MLGKLQLLAFLSHLGAGAAAESSWMWPSLLERVLVALGAITPKPLPHLPAYPWSIAEAFNARLEAVSVPVPRQPGLGVLSLSIGVSSLPV